jgi:beta-N-acetylhexosaminidase
MHKPVRPTLEGRKWAEQTLKQLSLEKKVGQMLQVRYYGDYKDFNSEGYRQVRDEVQKYHIGSVLLVVHFDHADQLRSSPQNAAKVANQLQTDSELPLLFAADFERGVASRLRDAPEFPWPMAFGAVGDRFEVERFAAITARQARAIGVQWALAPVADVNDNPANPIISDRSFGDDPEQVGELVAAFIRGAHENGLLVTAKHFPGYGDSSVDSHHAVASIDGDLSHLQAIELPPFKKAIEAGVDSILLAHARVPAIDPNPDKIATISSKVVTEVLKHELGFRGVVLTDAMQMAGLAELYDPQKGSPLAQAAVDAIKAGCDIIMMPTDLDGAFHAIVKAVRNGDIPESNIDASVLKILEMKASVGLDKSRLVDVGRVSSLVSKPEDMEFAEHITDEAVTLVRENGRTLPIQKSGVISENIEGPAASSQTNRGVVAIVLAEVLESSNGHSFEAALKSRCPDAEVFYFDGRFSVGQTPQILKAVSEAAKVVVVAYSTARQIRVNGELVQSFGPWGPGRLLQQILTIAPEKTAVIALGSPYLIENFPQIQTYICTYAMAASSEVSAVKALFGELQARGKLPVTLPDVAARGFSLPWPIEQRR